MYLPVATFFEPVGRYVMRDPLVVSPEAPCAQVVERINTARMPGAMVVDGDRRLVGIVTTGDVARRIAFQLAREDPVRLAMTAPVQALREDEPLYRALARMRKFGWRRMPVIDAAGRVVGLFSMDAALEKPLELLDRIGGDDSVAGLARVKGAQVELARALLDDDRSVVEVQALFAEMNLDIHRRLCALVLESLERDGWGPAPVPFSVIVMGSIGRGEALLYPDQDNGLILEDHEQSDRLVAERFFAELADRLCESLAQVGFPLCRGNVMATNPVWRGTLARWRAHIDSWVTSRSEHAILDADICFDFRAATPPEHLAEALRRHALALLPRARPFLRDMAISLSDHRVALGLFGGFHTEPAGDGPRINLKLRGLMPLVGGVRLLALREAVAETSTLGRIEALAARGVLKPDEAEGLADGYRDLTALVLRQQLADHAAARPPSNLVSSAGWSRSRRQRLTATLRAVDDLQRRVREDLTGQVL
jgi:signal-transduction protein with cAMP-binding, CBS, and nucleotidyltransferase domain